MGLRVVRSRWLVLGRVVGKGDLEVDLDPPAADAHLFDDESKQAPATVEVEVVQRGRDGLAERGESATQPVLGGELGAAFGERLLLSCELVLAGGEPAGASGQLLEIEKTGLVGVKQPSALGVLGVEGGVQSLELAGDQLVLVGGAREDGALAGE